jgi:outer membrane protein TolC
LRARHGLGALLGELRNDVLDVGFHSLRRNIEDASDLQQTETALDAYVREIDHNHELRRARDSAEKASDQARALFRFGRIGILDVLNAEAALATAETAVAASDAAMADSEVNVFLALGGGWGP